jgi:hypothetical protein
MLLAGIFPAKQTQQKVMECSKIKSHESITFLLLTLWEPIISYNFFYDKLALECSSPIKEISSPIIKTHKNPPPNPYFFSVGVHKKC